LQHLLVIKLDDIRFPSPGIRKLSLEFGDPREEPGGPGLGRADACRRG
jgi:hypothetical protein